MLRRYWVLGALVGALALVVLLVAAIVLTRSPSLVSASAQTVSGSAAQDTPLQQIAITPTTPYLWSYAVKFVCGYQPPSSSMQPITGEPVVEPGNYATEINIHNYNYRSTPLHKKILLLVNRGMPIAQEQSTAAPQPLQPLILGPDYATMDDCNGLWSVLYPGIATPAVMPLTIGYLVILSPFDLDVDAVYTANAPGATSTSPAGTSIDEVRVLGKRVYVPIDALP